MILQGSSKFLNSFQKLSNEMDHQQLKEELKPPNKNKSDYFVKGNYGPRYADSNGWIQCGVIHNEPENQGQKCSENHHVKINPYRSYYERVFLSTSFELDHR